MNEQKNLWTLTPEEALSQLEASPEGLTGAEAGRRLTKYGPNVLAEGGRKGPFRIFLEQFADFLVLILIAAAVVSAILGDVESMAVILAVITMNAILGTVQTVKAQASLDSLKEMSAPTAKVLRDGMVQVLPGRVVVPGDIVLLEAGDAVCADGRLLECASLKADESALTGESLPVEKTAAVIDGDVPLGDRKNLVFSGTFITYGRGRFLVTATGMDTEMGRIAALLHAASEKKTPLQVSLDQFGRNLSIGILALCAGLFAVSVLVRHESVMDAFLFAVALAVAAIPEALSSIVTIVLSFGTRKMAREGAVIRKLQAVEGLGSVSVICSDKTGTLTQNRMTVRQLYVGGRIIPAAEADFSDPIQEPLLRTALLCSDATVNENGEVGDPTETALVRLGEDFHFDEEETRRKWPRLGELPFDSDRKLMSTVHRFSGGLMLMTKGAVDVILGRSTLSQQEKEEVEAVNQQFSDQGLRVLAFACRPISDDDVTLDIEDELIFLGLIAMMDPPREESKQAVADCVSAGIRPIMITGDHVVTASAIAREIGILTPDKRAVEGAVLDGMTDRELLSFVPEVSVYARVSPEHKIRIVRAWQDRGNLVAMTGDGVNDAPALKQADIGVAMGVTGTEVAKDAAGMVLTDDNFATIVHAVKNGRNVYANIKRSIQFLLSGNLAGILVVLAAALANLPVPFAAVHLLFINLLTDSLPAIALGLEPHTEAVMHEKPRPRSEGILTKAFLTSVGIEGAVIAAATMIGFLLGLHAGGAKMGASMAFATLCLSRLFHGFDCKAAEPVLFTRRFWSNLPLLGAFAVGSLLLTAALAIPGLQHLMQATPLPWFLALAIPLLAAGSMVVIQFLKWVRTRMKKG